MIAPIGWAAWKNDGFPRWFAYVTLVLVVEQSIETVTIFGKSGFTEPGGAMNFKLGAGLYLVWLVGAGVAARPAPACSAAWSPHPLLRSRSSARRSLVAAVCATTGIATNR